DIIVSNPPYVTEAEWSQLQPEVRVFEPHSALHGGQDGTHVQRRLLEEAWKYLTPGGLLLMELGWQQSATVYDLAVGAGRYATPTFCFDEAGIARVLRVRTLDRS
ncbi:MAG: peptide chain release factor N(5)-glutamine methyltransferase, partial [Nitrospiraceae bacterium]